MLKHVLAVLGCAAVIDAAVVQCTMSGTSGLLWECDDTTYNLSTLQGPSGAE